MIYTYTPTRLIPGSALTNSLATYYTASTAYGALLNELMVINNDTVARQVTVHIIPAAGTAGNATKILDELLQPGQKWTESLFSVIPKDYFIQAVAAVSAVVTINASGSEIS